MRHKRDKRFHRVQRSDRATRYWFILLVALLLAVPLLVLEGERYLDGVILPPQQRVPSAGVEDAVAVPTELPEPEPSQVPSWGVAAVTAPEQVTNWKPQIAYIEYWEDGLDAEFVAKHVNWLAMRYGLEQQREEVLEAGYTNPILQYTTAFQILGPGPYTHETDSCENNYTPLDNNPMWTKDFCELVHSHESWFLHNGKGERLYNEARNWDGTYIYDYYMNPASNGFREFWVAQMQRQRHAQWTGFFLDNVPVSFDYLRTRADNQDGIVKEYDSNVDWQRDISGLLQHIKQSFPEYPLWGNIIEAGLNADAWDVYHDVLDGFQEENFATGWVGGAELTAEQWEAMLQRVERAVSKGKGVVLYSQGLQDDYARMRFGLASYLLIAAPDQRVAFRYAYAEDYKPLWWYPEYDYNLGLPKGKRYWDGEVWRRDFQCGRVSVDPSTHTGMIEQSLCQP